MSMSHLSHFRTDNFVDGHVEDLAGVRPIGGIGNYYGGLYVWDRGGVTLWGVENYDGVGWEEIPRSLYDALMAFEGERQRQEEEA